jgi:hypothetical protein
VRNSPPLLSSISPPSCIFKDSNRPLLQQHLARPYVSLKRMQKVHCLHSMPSQHISALTRCLGARKPLPSERALHTRQPFTRASHTGNNSQQGLHNGRPFTETLLRPFTLIHDATLCADTPSPPPHRRYTVFTQLAALDRGVCCGSGCRHCAYNHERVPRERRARLAPPITLPRKQLPQYQVQGNSK